jgi:hypothetical protein
MNRNKQKYPVIFFAVVISSLLVMAASIGVTITFQGATAQQQNTINTTNITSNQTSGIANQTGSTDAMQNQSMANQTGGDPALANLTQSDFESVTEDLGEARQALQNNDTNGVLDELNSASGELFQVISGQFDPAQMEAMTEQFRPLQTHIDQAQEAILKNDITETLEEINSANSELLKITQELPPSEEQDD